MATDTPTPIPPARNIHGLPPRVIFFRHGETEWSLSGQYTSITDLPLTENGEVRVSATGQALIGPDRLVDLRSIEKVFCSPRTRARRTLELLVNSATDQPEPKPELEETTKEKPVGKTEKNVPVEYTEAIREWDYGLYEGMLTKDIQRWRIKKGLNPRIEDIESGKVKPSAPKKVKIDVSEVPKPGPEEDLHEEEFQPWLIWRDGCEGGELPAEICDRIDGLIEDIIKVQQKAVSEGRNGDVVLIAHGHILRVFSMRWLRLPLLNDPQIRLILEAGGSGVLSYEHSKWEERAINLGGAFTVPQQVV